MRRGNSNQESRAVGSRHRTDHARDNYHRDNSRDRRRDRCRRRESSIDSDGGYSLSYSFIVIFAPIHMAVFLNFVASRTFATNTTWHSSGPHTCLKGQHISAMHLDAGVPTPPLRPHRLCTHTRPRANTCLSGQHISAILITSCPLYVYPLIATRPSTLHFPFLMLHPRTIFI
jgi:hypothetical protein